MRESSPQLPQPARVILVAIAVLVMIGVACIYVTDTHYIAGHDGPHNAVKQVVRVAVSVLVAMVVLRIGYRRIAEHAYAIFIAALILLIPLLLAKVFKTGFGGLADPRNGAYRWIHLPGFPLQPSELMKVAYVIALAWYLRYRKNYRRFSGLMVPFVLSSVPFALILLEPDLGTCLLLLPVLLTMLYMAGARVRHLLIIVLIGVAAAPLAWGQIRGYQRLRVTAVLLQSDSIRRAVIDREAPYDRLATKRQAIEWTAGSGYQLVHSKNAIGSGGLVGYGWGDGVYVESGLLPDRHNDFVFALIAHQWGLLGCLLVLACYAVIVLCGVVIASSTDEPFARLLAVGVLALLVSQVLINIGMAVGLMPITGMTLPFVSYGGSSLLTNFIAIALLVSVSQERPFLLAVRPFEYRDKRRDKTRLIGRDQPPGEGPRKRPAGEPKEG